MRWTSWHLLLKRHQQFEWPLCIYYSNEHEDVLLQFTKDEIIQGVKYRSINHSPFWKINYMKDLIAKYSQNVLSTDICLDVKFPKMRKKNIMKTVLSERSTHRRISQRQPIQKAHQKTIRTETGVNTACHHTASKWNQQAVKGSLLTRSHWVRARAFSRSACYMSNKWMGSSRKRGSTHVHINWSTLSACKLPRDPTAWQKLKHKMQDNQASPSPVLESTISERPPPTRTHKIPVRPQPKTKQWSKL